jgi:tetratricopeptide (TPR) repeat protein
MEIIEMRTSLLAVLLILIAFGLKAQNEKQLQQSFSDSYVAETNGEYSKAIEGLRKYYREDSYALNIRLGWLTYMNGSFVESAAYYSKAIQLMPMSIEARLGIALPASAQGNWDQVIMHYNEILRIDPNHYTTNYRMGNIYYYREDYKAASKYFERIANLYPFDYDAVHMFAWVNLQMGKSTEARALFNKALLIRPKDESCIEGLNLIK